MGRDSASSQPPLGPLPVIGRAAPSSESALQQIVSTRLPLDTGEFQLYLFSDNQDQKDHMALVCGDVRQAEGVLVRVHSECFTGEVLGSKRCDCRDQLNDSLAMIAAVGKGVLVYLRQEGRGIGLRDKLRAYNLQDAGYNTAEANLLLGHPPDARHYGVAVNILQCLEVISVRLLTNNPAKTTELEQFGVEVCERVPLVPHLTPENQTYLKTKIATMGHKLRFEVGPNGTTYLVASD